MTRRQTSSYFFPTDPFAVAAKSEGVHIYHLNIGQPDIETPETMRLGYQEYRDKVLPYGPSAGLPDYLAKLVTYYGRFGINLDEKDLFVTTGGSDERALYQVALEMRDLRTRERELRALTAAMQETGLRLGTIVSLDTEDRIDTPAGEIEVVPAWWWALHA